MKEFNFLTGQYKFNGTGIACPAMKVGKVELGGAKFILSTPPTYKEEGNPSRITHRGIYTQLLK